MIGAVIGDIVGSRFEYQNHKDKVFELFTNESVCTDDTVLTAAIACALMESGCRQDEVEHAAIQSLREFGEEFPRADYGLRFRDWLASDDPQPYDSWGNGAAMRVSPCGDAARSLDEAITLARDVTAVTHNHPEGLRGGEATAAAVYLAKAGVNKDDIRRYIVENYYQIDFTLDDIREEYAFNESSQNTVPQALEAFFESESFEDAIRCAISIGGDSDTLAAITGGIAGRYYGVPAWMQMEAQSRMPQTVLTVYRRFCVFCAERAM